MSTKDDSGQLWALSILCALLLALLIVAGAVRFYRIGLEDYWLDEIHTLANSAARRGDLEAIPHGVVLLGVPRYAELRTNSTVGAVWRGMAEDTHPPLYFILVNIWRRWFGDGEAAVRSLSAVFSQLSILVVGGILWWAGRRRMMLIAVSFLALSYVDIYEAQQARPYASPMFFVLCSTVLLIGQDRVLRKASSHDPRVAARILIPFGYALCLMAAVLTHYFVVLPLLAHALYAGHRFRGRLLIRWAIAVVAAAIGWVVLWGPAFLEQQGAISNQPWLDEYTSDHFMRTVMRAADLPMRLLFAYEPFTFRTSRSIAGGAVILVLAWILRPANRGNRPRGLATLVGAMFAIPVVVFLAIDLLLDRQMLAHLRYCYFAWPGLLGMLVLALDRLTPRRRRIALGTFILGAALTLRLPTQHTPDARVTAAVVDECARSSGLLVYDAIGWPPHWALRMYAVVCYYQSDSKLPLVLLREPPGDDLLREMMVYDRLIVVCPRPAGVSELLPDAFDVTRRLTDYIDQMGWVYLLERSSEARP